MGQRPTALNDYFALTSVPDRPRLKGVQVAEHLRHLCVLDFSLSHRTLLPLLLITRLGLNLMKRVYPGYGQPKPIPAVTSSDPRGGQQAARRINRSLVGGSHVRALSLIPPIDRA